MPTLQPSSRYTSTELTPAQQARRRFVVAGLSACVTGIAAATGYMAESMPLQAPTPDRSYVRMPTSVQTGQTPITLFVDTKRPFSQYLAAILRVEGVLPLTIHPHTAISARLLTTTGIVVLCTEQLAPCQVELLRSFVKQGGVLIGIRSDRAMAAVFGIRFLASMIEPGLLRVLPDTRLTGLDAMTLQFHSQAEHIALDGATALGTLANSDGWPGTTPLITLNRLGAGWAVYWAFDLAETIALIRQGNPVAAGEDRDIVPGVRTQDSFVGWINPEYIMVPQADEHQRLLAYLLHWLSRERMPLPQLWYFPAQQQALLIATSDAHGMPTSTIDSGLSLLEEYAATGSIYYTTIRTSVARRIWRRTLAQLQTLPGIGGVLQPPDIYPVAHDIQRWRARGHRIGLHPYVEAGVEAGYREYYSDFVRKGFGEPDPTARTHRVLWSGWVETAKVQARYGIRMNLDYYHAGHFLYADQPARPTGYLSGTGLAAPFVDWDGMIIPVYQQHTHLVDEFLLPLYEAGEDIGLSAEQAVGVSQLMIDHALDRYPTAIGMQWHLDPLSFGERSKTRSETWIRGTLEYARERNVPIIAAEYWLSFTEARMATQVDQYHWDATTGLLSFTLTSPDTHFQPLELMLPSHTGKQILREIRLNGTTVALGQRRHNRQTYLVCAIPAGVVRVTCVYHTRA